MPFRKIILSLGAVCAAMMLFGTVRVAAQTDPARRFRVIDGQLREIEVVATSDSTAVDSVIVRDIPAAVMTEEASGSARRARREADENHVRHSVLFRDSIPLSRVAALSVVIPGFSQAYNRQAWKLPILYGVTGGLTYAGLRANSRYRFYKQGVDYLMSHGAPQSEIDKLMEPMIKHNTAKTIFLTGAIASYIYFIGDGVMNYDGGESRVKIATTLSTLCPGAGQFYNKSYWKVPIIVGAFATMGYVIDWNNRGYKRIRTAYDIQVMIEAGNEGLSHEFSDRNISSDQLKTWKNSYRRNRDLSIIITAGFYILNIVDAHVDAQFKDFNVSDDLAMNLYPSVDQIYLSGGASNSYGMTLSLRF